MKTQITKANVEDVISEIESAFYDIPFENSKFQTEHFVINAALTPERAYRAIGLRMFNRIHALQEAQFNLLREDIDIEELQVKIGILEKSSRTNAADFKIRRAEIDIAQKRAKRAYTNKLINDALVELNFLYDHFKALPRFTREEFEKAESGYFGESLYRQIEGIVGAQESLRNMQEKTPALSHQTKMLGGDHA